MGTFHSENRNYFPQLSAWRQQQRDSQRNEPFLFQDWRLRKLQVQVPEARGPRADVQAGASRGIDSLSESE